MEHVDKYWWIDSHPSLNKDGGCTIFLTPQMVCPETNCIEKDKSLNTKPVWWVELSYSLKNDVPELDYLGDTVFFFVMRGSVIVEETQQRKLSRTCMNLF